MPIYERRCQKCNVKYSMLCRVADRDVDDECPHCGHDQTERVMSATKTTFKFADKSGLKRER